MAFRIRTVDGPKTTWFPPLNEPGFATRRDADAELRKRQGHHADTLRRYGVAAGGLASRLREGKASMTVVEA